MVGIYDLPHCMFLFGLNDHRICFAVNLLAAAPFVLSESFNCSNSLS